MIWKTILSLGDNITIGSRTYLSYPDICGNLLRLKTNEEWNVINFAQADLTTVALHRQMPGQFLKPDHVVPDLITIMIGTNDARTMVAPDDFAIAYRQVLTKASILSPQSTIVAIPIPPVHKGVRLPYFYSMNQMIQQYNRIIQEQTASLGLPSLLPPTAAQHFADGVHFSKKGNFIMGSQIAEFLLSKKHFYNSCPMSKTTLTQPLLK